MTPDAADDRELVERLVRRRDDAAFRVLYRRHTPALFATAWRLSSGAGDAEDAVHDAWIRAMERLADFQWRSSLRTWLTGIVVNVVREAHRSRDRVVLNEDRVRAEPVPSRDIHLALDLGAAIARLAPGHREVFVLHDVDGFTHEEIGRMLGVEPGTSKSQLARARRHLRRLLGEEAAPSSAGERESRNEA